MTMYTLTIEDTPRSEDVQRLAQGLTAHALPYTQVPGFTPLGVFLKDEHGALVGGVWGQVNWIREADRGAFCMLSSPIQAYST